MRVQRWSSAGAKGKARNPPPFVSGCTRDPHPAFKALLFHPAPHGGVWGGSTQTLSLHILPQHLLNAGKTQKSRLSRSAPPLHRVRSLTPDPSVALDRAGGTPEPNKSVTSLKSTSKPPPRSRGSPANGFRCKFTAASGVFDSRSSRPGARPGQGEGDLGVAGLEQGPGAAGPGKGGKK